MNERPAFYLPSPASKNRESRSVRELRTIAEALAEHPELLEAVEADIGQRDAHGDGTKLMTSEQILRALVLRQLKGYSYAELSFHLLDSMSSRGFCWIAPEASGPSEEVLKECLESVRDETWERIHAVLKVGAGRLWKKKYGSRLRE